MYSKYLYYLLARLQYYNIFVFNSALYLLKFWKYVLGWFWKRSIYFSYKTSKKKEGGEKSPLKWTVQLQSLSCVRLFVTPWTTAHQASLCITNSQSLLKLMSIELVMPSNHLILCHPLLLPSIFPSIRVFSSESKKLPWVAVYSLRRICCFMRFSYSFCWKKQVKLITPMLLKRPWPFPFPLHIRWPRYWSFSFSLSP